MSTDRMHLRVDPEIKRDLERAAEITRMSVN
jgi:hypothetical protein